MIDNGRRAHLVIEGVFDGPAGLQGGLLAFVPNLTDARPDAVHGGLLDGMPIRLTASKDPVGPFWTARYEVFR